MGRDTIALLLLAAFVLGLLGYDPFPSSEHQHMRRRGRGFTLIEFLVVLAIVCCLLALLLPFLGVGWGGEESVTGVVTRVYERGPTHFVAVRAGDGDGDVETFRNVDMIGKRNSTTIQDNLEVGRRYELRVWGTRNEAWSQFRNILSVKKLE